MAPATGHPLAPPRDAPLTSDLPAPLDRFSLAEELIGNALDAQRQGMLAALVQSWPRATRWVLRHHLTLARGTALDALPLASDLAEAASLLLRWGITQLRPDLAPSLDGIPHEAWLDQPAWRPMLALLCHARLAPVPAFPQRYRPRPDEAPAEHLCGLWGVDTSTFYRTLERGKRRLAQLALDGAVAVPRRLALRRFVVAEAVARHRLGEASVRAAWHGRQAQRARQVGDAASALWHAVESGDGAAATDLLLALAPALAGEPETDALVERLAARGLPLHQQFELWMARAALARTRSALEREQQALERALQVATELGSPRLLGRMYGALGRFHESRDADRAFACYEDSARYLLAADPQHQDPATVADHMTTLVRLAWMYVLRNHPRAKPMLEQAEALRREKAVPDDLAGLLEQTWGEYWRIAGDVPRALEAKHRALNIFERLGDQRSVLVTYLNLVLLHGAAKELDRAKAYAQRIFDVTTRATVEPAILVSTHGNLATCFVWADRYDLAADEFKRALELSLAANLRLHANRARYNLANAYYRRFLQTGDPEHERLGDAELAAFLAAPASESIPSLIEDARTLKSQVLGAQPERSADRLLDSESAAHLPETADIRRQRERLLAPDLPPADQVGAHLAIARAYLSISAQEREAARALVQRHGLQAQFSGEFDELRSAFERELTREQQLAGPWKQAAADLLDDERRAALISHLLREGAINKSGYAALCGVSPATASKHLASFTERGLLQQTGKGPATRYQLAP